MTYNGKVYLGVGVVLAAVVLATAGGWRDDTPAARAQATHEEANFQLALRGAETLKEATRNPKSFELVSALVMPDGATVCYEFRAQNGFGGMNVDRAVLSPAGVVSSEEPGFSAQWHRRCAGRTGEEKAANVRWGLKQIAAASSD